MADGGARVSPLGRGKVADVEAERARVVAARNAELLASKGRRLRAAAEAAARIALERDAFAPDEGGERPPSSDVAPPSPTACSGDGRRTAKRGVSRDTEGDRVALRLATPKQLRKAKRALRDARNERRQQAWRAECAAKYDGVTPPGVPVELWQMASEIKADRGGWAARYWIERMARRYGGASVAPFIRGALAIDDEGKALYDWRSDRARNVLAVGLFKLSMSRRARREKYNRIVRGIPLGCIAALLRDPWTGRQPCPTQLTGRWRDGTWLDGCVGYVRALVECGALYKQQLPAAHCERWEVGPSGYAMNRYWLRTWTQHESYDMAREHELAWVIAEGGDVPLRARSLAPPLPS